MRSVLLLLAPLAMAACFHSQAVLPGVIDMRTDGSGLASASSPVVASKQARGGAEALALGAGLSVVGDKLTVEDRHYWIIGSVPIVNDSPTPELEAALAAGYGLTSVNVGEEIDAIDLIAGIFAPLVFPVSSWVLPPHTFTARARVVAAPPGQGGKP